jgi:hypothetical protein
MPYFSTVIEHKPAYLRLLHCLRAQDIATLLLYCSRVSVCGTHAIHLVYRIWQTTPRVVAIDHTVVWLQPPAKLPEHFTVGFLWGKLPNPGCQVMNFPVPWHFSKTINITQISSQTNTMQLFSCDSPGKTRERLKRPKLLPHSARRSTDPSRWPRSTLYPQKLALTSSTSGDRSVSIVRSRTQATIQQ